MVVLHGLVIDDIDDGDDEGLGLLLDPVQQRLGKGEALHLVNVDTWSHLRRVL